MSAFDDAAGAAARRPAGAATCASDRNDLRPRLPLYAKFAAIRRTRHDRANGSLDKLKFCMQNSRDQGVLDDCARPASQRPPFPADSRPEPGARPHPAGDEPADHRPPRARVRARSGKKVLAGMQQVFQTRHPVVIYPASGTGAWEAALVEHAEPGRRGADVRDRPLRLAVAEDGAAPRARARVPRLPGTTSDRPAARAGATACRPT